MYDFRDQLELEVDFLFPDGAGGLWMVECEASRTVQPATAPPMSWLPRAMARAAVRQVVVHRPPAASPPSRAVAPAAEAPDLPAFAAALPAARPLRSPAKRTRKGAE